MSYDGPLPPTSAWMVLEEYEHERDWWHYTAIAPHPTDELATLRMPLAQFSNLLPFGRPEATEEVIRASIIVEPLEFEVHIKPRALW